jgi:hypothetical protein
MSVHHTQKASQEEVHKDLYQISKEELYEFTHSSFVDESNLLWPQYAC